MRVDDLRSLLLSKEAFSKEAVSKPVVSIREYSHQGALMLKALILFVMCATAFATNAIERIVVNEAKVLVDDQSSRTQKSAAKKALREVFLKMSGSSETLSNEGVRAALASPEALLRSYRYSYNGNETYYVAEFDSSKIAEILQREMLPLWGDRRPETLIWLAIQDDKENKVIIDEALKHPISEAINTTARERGLPLSLPLMDLTDSVNISTYDVWGRFVEPVRNASERYQVDNIIAARVYKNDATSVPDFPREPEGPASTENEETDVSSDESNYSSIDELVQSQFDNGNVDSVEAVPNDSGAYQAVGNKSTYVDETTSAVETDINGVMIGQQPEQAAPLSVKPFTMDEFKEYAKRAEAGDFGLDWVFISNDGVSYGSIYDDTPEALGNALIDAYTNYLSSQYAVIGANEADREILEISVANVGSLSSYASLKRYLMSLSVIENAALVKQSGTVATFSVTLIGTSDDLMNSVGLETKLNPVTDAYGQPVQGFNFYWNN